MRVNLAPLYREAAGATARGSKSFYFATRFFPDELARAAHGVYWFCRYTDDLVDECDSVERGRRDLDAWAEALARALSTGRSADPVLSVFADTVAAYRIPHEYPLELIEGMRMDLNGTRYRTFGELRQFCYRVASVVGLMMSHVIGFEGDALNYAVDLGIAMQLTNILRDIGEDLERGRLYLPSDELQRFGYSEADLRLRRRNVAFEKLMDFQVARARDYYQRSLPGIALLDVRGRFAVKVAADVYRAILGRIERSGYDVFEHRAVVSPLEKYWITLRGVAVPAARRSAERFAVLASLAGVRPAIANASRATLAGLLVHYVCYYLAGTPLWTDTIAQWIMARTPSSYALWILANLGAWAKPFAMTGGLAALGFGLTLVAFTRRWWLMPVAAAIIAVAFGRVFEYSSVAGQLSFWLPGVLLLLPRAASKIATPGVSRREAFVMTAGTLAVAAESFGRERVLERRAITPRGVARFAPPPDTFAPGLVRKAITPTTEFYGMSKNTVDPAPDPRAWKLRITVDGKAVREVGYADLLAMPRVSGYSTMRCVSNTLKSDLMGTALWTGVRLRQLIDPAALPAGLSEAAIIGVDGHGDSLPPEFAFSDGTLLAFGMNGKTLERTHGFPLRLIVPRYYGFKNVKWIGEIAFVRQPYIGTWPKLGYTKEPAVHTGSHIDHIARIGSELRIGGVAFAGDRGIQAVQVRAANGPWHDATVEPALSPLCWRRWVATIPVNGETRRVQARAMDGTGAWQADAETPLFPNGVQGPTIRSVS